MGFKENCCGPIGILSYLNWKEGSHANQYLMTVLINGPATAMALVVGFLAPSLAALRAKQGPLGYNIEEYNMSWVASIPFFVSFPILLFAGVIADRIGRKKTLLLASVSLIICWFTMIAWMKTEGLIMGRAFAGIGSGLGCVVIPLYVTEIADIKIRGSLGSFIIFAKNLGITSVYIIKDLISFKAVVWMALLVPTIHLIVFFNAPESPLYLVRKGKIRKAIIVLAWLQSLPADEEDVTNEVQALRDDPTVTGKYSEFAKVVILVTNTVTLRAYSICAVLVVLQECSGYFILVTFASDIFKTADIDSLLSPNKQAIIMSFVQLCGSAIAFFMVEKVGRKILLLVTSFSCGVGMLGLAVSFYIVSAGSRCPTWLPICSMSISLFSIAAGFQPTPYVLLSEMFTFEIHGLVSATIMSLAALMDFIQVGCYQLFLDMMGESGTFAMYTGVCFMATAFTAAFLPETRNKSLSQIYSDIGGNKRNRDHAQLRYI